MPEYPLLCEIQVPGTETNKLIQYNLCILLGSTSPGKSGPLCFDCQYFDDPTTCDKVTLCGADEVLLGRYIILFQHLFIHPSIYSLICSVIRPFIYSFIQMYLFIGLIWLFEPFNSGTRPSQIVIQWSVRTHFLYARTFVPSMSLQSRKLILLELSRLKK